MNEKVKLCAKKNIKTRPQGVVIMGNLVTVATGIWHGSNVTMVTKLALLELKICVPLKCYQISGWTREEVRPRSCYVWYQ